MFSHVMIGSNDLERSKRFYDALFATIGGRKAMFDERGRLVYAHRGGYFMVTKPLDGEPATCGNGGTIGITVDDPAQVDAWQAAGVAHGGVAIEDPPGVREVNRSRLYLAYLRDPDGNKLCAMHRVPD